MSAKCQLGSGGSPEWIVPREARLFAVRGTATPAPEPFERRQLESARVAQGHSDMTRQENIERVWEIIEKVGVCMLTTQFAGGLRARPLEARPDRDAGLIFFVTDIHSAKEDEIEAAPEVGLVFIDPNDKAYLSITARARVVRDAEMTRKFWRNTDAVWWPGGPQDPDVCLLRIEPFTAELWDGPSRAAVTFFEFAKAKLTGAEPNLGENRKVTVEM
jgi:general stress protein 26